MKLTKDQKQKIVLGAMLLVFVIYAFVMFLIGPCQREQAAKIRDASALDPKIAAAKAQIAKTNALQAKLPDAGKFEGQIRAMIPDGSPLAWFPPRVSEYFKKQGVDKVAARPNSDAVDKELTGYRKLNWGVEIPKCDFVPLGTAISEMENGEPLLEIQAIEIEVSRDEVGAQRANLTVNNLVHL